MVRAGEKTFVIKKGTRQEVVTIDRLKRAYVDSSEEVPLTIPPKRGGPWKPQEKVSVMPEVVQKTLPDLQHVVPPKRSRLEHMTPSGLPELAAQTFDDEDHMILIRDQRSRYGRILQHTKKFGE